MAGARNWPNAIRAPGKIVARLLEQPQDLLATLALGNTFANAAMLAVALRMVFDGHWPLAADGDRCCWR